VLLEYLPLPLKYLQLVFNARWKSSKCSFSAINLLDDYMSLSDIAFAVTELLSTSQILQTDIWKENANRVRLLSSRLSAEVQSGLLSNMPSAA
jgi:hypothetical protein